MSSLAAELSRHLFPLSSLIFFRFNCSKSCEYVNLLLHDKSLFVARTCKIVVYRTASDDRKSNRVEEISVTYLLLNIVLDVL